MASGEGRLRILPMVADGRITAKAIPSGRRGKLLEVEHPAEGERVEIFLE